MNTPFEITRDEVLELAARKVVEAYENDYGGDDGIFERSEKIIRAKVGEMFSETKLKQRIDDCLTAELDRLLGTEIVPVDIWGEREGSPTTVRAQLAERAKRFWEVKVDREGRESTYGGVPRSEVLMQKILKDEFEKAIKTNADVIVAEFKKALTADATKIVTDHIDKLIKVQK